MTAWLDEVYALVARGDPDAAIDMLFAQVDDLLVTGEFRQIDAVLRTIDVKRLDTNLLIAVLAVTKPAVGRLHARQDFFWRAVTRLREIAPGHVAGLLVGVV